MLGISYMIYSFFMGGIVKIFDSSYNRKQKKKPHNDIYYFDSNFKQRSLKNDKILAEIVDPDTKHIMLVEAIGGEVVYDYTKEKIKNIYKNDYLPKSKEIYEKNVEKYFEAKNSGKYYFIKTEYTFDWNTGKTTIDFYKLRVSDGLRLTYGKSGKRFISSFNEPYLSEGERDFVSGLCVYLSKDSNGYLYYYDDIVKQNYDIIKNERIQNELNKTEEEMYEYAVSIGALLTLRHY